MEEAVTRYFRELLRRDFPNAGAIDDAAIFLEVIGERMINCGNTGNYMQLYIRVADHRIVEIKYLCSCEPTANVAVEVLCDLVKGRDLDEAATLSEEDFYRVLGCRGEELQTKVRGLLELLNEGITRYKTQSSACGPS